MWSLPFFHHHPPTPSPSTHTLGSEFALIFFFLQYSVCSSFLLLGTHTWLSMLKMSVFGVLLWLPTDSLEIHVIKGTWEATHFNWCALRFIFKTFTFDDLILRGSLISNNHSTANLFLTRKWEALGLGWQGAEQLWAADRLSPLLFSSFLNMGEPPILGQLGLANKKKPVLLPKGLSSSSNESSTPAPNLS